jgi:hypothetical protein
MNTKKSMFEVAEFGYYVGWNVEYYVIPFLKP